MKKIYKHHLFKVFTLNSVQVVLKMVYSFITIKLYASIIGSEGFAITGSFKNFSSSIKVFSTLGIDQGVVALVSKHKKNKAELHKVYATAFFTRLFFSVLVGLVLVILSSKVDQFVFFDTSFRQVILFFAITIPFFTFNSFLLSVINGLEKYTQFIWINMVSSFLGFLLFLSLIFYYRIEGALLHMVFFEILSLGVTLFFMKKIDLSLKIKEVDRGVFIKLVGFSTMVMFSSIIAPSSYFMIRKVITENLGVEIAGYWEGVTRLSEYYMMIVSSIISLYYFPKISSTQQYKVFVGIFKEYLKIFGIGFLFFGLLLYVFKDPIVSVVFSNKMNKVVDLLLFQLLGDLVKVITLFLGFKMLADRDLKKYIISEALFYVCFVGLSYGFMVQHYTIEYVVKSYLWSYVLLLVLMLWMYRKMLFKGQFFKISF